MARGARRHNESIRSVMEEAERNLLSAFRKSSKTVHRGLKGDARAKQVSDLLQGRLPSGYGVLCKGEVVDYLDQRSGEIDVVIFDSARNAVLSDEPLWIPAESLLAYVEVKSTLTEEEVLKSYIAASKINSLRPFKRSFTLASKYGDQAAEDAKAIALRCFRTVFAYESNLTGADWLSREWERIEKITRKLSCDPALIDRIVVLNRGLINPAHAAGTDELESSSALHQWFVNLANFLTRENGRRPPFDWQSYTKKSMPGWKPLGKS